MLRSIARSAALAAVAVAAACATPVMQGGGPRGSAASSSPSNAQGLPTWHGTLMSKNGSTVVGSTTVRPISDAGTQATLTLSGATAGGVFPWHVHTGTCAQTGGIVGPPTSYTAVAVGADGSGTVVVTLPFATPTSGAYSVNVHASPSDMGTIVACADLTS